MFKTKLGLIFLSGLLTLITAVAFAFVFFLIFLLLQLPPVYGFGAIVAFPVVMIWATWYCTLLNPLWRERNDR